LTTPIELCNCCGNLDISSSKSRLDFTFGVNQCALFIQEQNNCTN